MSLTTLIIAGLITSGEILYILHDMNREWFLTALGYKAYVDLVCGIGMTIYFAMSGTISGVVLAAIAGATLSLSLYCSKKIFGYRKYVGNGEWKTYEADWKLHLVAEKYGFGSKKAIANV